MTEGYVAFDDIYKKYVKKKKNLRSTLCPFIPLFFFRFYPASVLGGRIPFFFAFIFVSE